MKTIEPINILIPVPGFALFKDSEKQLPEDFLTERPWVLQDFQQGHREPEKYVEHIVRGMELAAERPDSLLVFSGGRTREGYSRWSEGASYLAVARHVLENGFDDPSGTLDQRMAAEEFAYDSLENVTRSLQLFFTKYQRLPSRVIMPGFEFKRDRLELHARTVGLVIAKSLSDMPDQSFWYEGVNDPEDMDTVMNGGGAACGEPATVEAFKKDPWLQSDKMKWKREYRNHLRLQHTYGDAPYTYPGAYAQAA